MTELHLSFAVLPPGLNGRDGLLRMHWTTRQQLMALWRGLVREQIQKQSTPFFDTKHPCAITATRCERRFMDWDNMGASLKPVLDGLIDVGVLADDGPRVVTHLTMYQEHPDKGVPASLKLDLIGLWEWALDDE